MDNIEIIPIRKEDIIEKEKIEAVKKRKKKKKLKMIVILI